MTSGIVSERAHGWCPQPGCTRNQAPRRVAGVHAMVGLVTLVGGRCAR